jgi:hypothetical protein
MVTDRCAICGHEYGEPWRSINQSYDERTCEGCGRSVCAEHFVGGDRICTDCAASPSRDPFPRPSRATAGVPTPTASSKVSSLPSKLPIGSVT